jgi:DNA polymerase-3 subunit gamma/tau
MTLYLKYRPNSFKEIVGNNQIVDSLQSMLEDNETCPHAFLLSGPTGCGKTTIGRIIADKLECFGNDLREIDAADFRGIDTIREIRKQSQFMPLEGNCRIWILDECHQLGSAAQPALLKALEDTPSHVYYILCTTDPQKLLPTIRGRCSQFQVQPLIEKDMFRLLRQVVKAENKNLPKVVYEQIIQDSLGHPRNALQILDQVLHAPANKRLEIAKQTAEEQSQSIELCRALIKAEGWKYIASILSGLQNQDPESIRRHVLGYCNSVLLKGENDQAGLVMENFVEPFYNTGWPGLTFACYSIVKGE